MPGVDIKRDDMVRVMAGLSAVSAMAAAYPRPTADTLAR